MKTRSILFDKPLHAVVQEADFSDDSPDDDELIVKNLYSLVSAGTELAIYRGAESWAPLPYVPGYASVGEVLSVGRNVDGMGKGDLVFTCSGHREHARVKFGATTIRLPKDGDLTRMIFSRMAAVSITAPRVSPPELGDWVAIFGLGVVGNLAGQLFALGGARVIGIDPCPQRRKTALQCGFEKVLDSDPGTLVEEIKGWTNNQGVETAVEATGIPSMVGKIFPVMKSRGEIVLLGSPRGECQGDMTDLLNHVHLWPHGCITLKGAHEWRFPLKGVDGCKHSIQRNYGILFDLITRDKLKTQPLVSHVVSPFEAQNVYAALNDRKDGYLGVLFDWDNLGCVEN
ncbi:MAG: zinc-binding alcohol dehydrogenase [Verrucomicrobiae bacterium]|nr:zinc-binding alcohol dehydrogenase [Verrucomicrobiae bacterium]